MTANVRHPASVESATEVNRVVKVTAMDLTVASPDTLTLLKRKVNDADLLEVSNNASWLSKRAATSVAFRQMLASGRYDRIRYRHYVYGLDKAGQQRAIDALTAAGF